MTADLEWSLLDKVSLKLSQGLLVEMIDFRENLSKFKHPASQALIHQYEKNGWLGSRINGVDVPLYKGYTRSQDQLDIVDVLYAGFYVRQTPSGGRLANSQIYALLINMPPLTDPTAQRRFAEVLRDERLPKDAETCRILREVRESFPEILSPETAEIFAHGVAAYFRE